MRYTKTPLFHILVFGSVFKGELDGLEGYSGGKMKRNGNSLSIEVEEDKCPKISQVSDLGSWPDGW